VLNTRRHLLQSFVAVAGAFATGPILLSGQTPHPTPQPLPSPNAPNPNYPQGLHGPGPTPPDAKAINKQNQALMKEDIEKMYSVVSELRQDIQTTDTTSVFSVSFVKRAKEIEKLAKHVRDLARG
jgi:hypothetical protein